MLTSAFLYPYHRPYYFHNSSSQRDENLPVYCVCDKGYECGCDDTNANDTLKELVGDGRLSSLNSSVVRVGTYEGHKAILINGTLPNGTTTSGAEGMRHLSEAIGYWPAVAAVLAAVVIV